MTRQQWRSGHTPPPSNTDKAPPDANPNNDTADGGYQDFPVAGVVFPYRGMEQHGVPATHPVWTKPSEDCVDVEGELSATEQEDSRPVPVRIVQEFAREIRTWNATQTRADANPRELVGRNLQRTKLLIRNLSVDVVVYIGRANGANYLSGYPVDPGQTIELNTTDEVHGVVGDITKVALIAVLQQFTIEGTP